MTIRNHVLIGAVAFLSIAGIVGSAAPDLLLTPVAIQDWRRIRAGKKIQYREDFWVKLHWACHSVWALAIVWLVAKPVFAQAWGLHILLDLISHSGSKRIMLLYPLSRKRFELC